MCTIQSSVDMGVRSLLRFIYSKYPHCIEYTPLSSLEGCNLAVDGNNLMHCIADKVEDELIKGNYSNSSQLDKGFVLATTCNVLVNNLAPLLNHKINLIIIMDGRIPEMKLTHAMDKNGRNHSMQNVDCESFQTSTGSDWRGMSHVPSIHRAVSHTDLTNTFAEVPAYFHRKHQTCEPHIISECSCCDSEAKPSLQTFPDTKCLNVDGSSHHNIQDGVFVISYAKSDAVPSSKPKRTRHRPNRTNRGLDRIGQMVGTLGYNLGNEDPPLRYRDNSSLLRTLAEETSTWKTMSQRKSYRMSNLQGERWLNSCPQLNGMERKSYFVDILLMMGIPTIRASGEAERLCSILLRDNVVQGVLSRDTDHLVLGCSNLYLSMGSQTLEQLNLNHLLQCMGLSHSQFVDFCILCGTDYNMSKQRMSRCLMIPERSLEIIRRYTTIENADKQMHLPDTRYSQCRAMYTLRVTDIPELELVEKQLVPDKELWITNSILLGSAGMSHKASTVMDRYYGI